MLGFSDNVLVFGVELRSLGILPVGLRRVFVVVDIFAFINLSLDLVRGLFGPEFSFGSVPLWTSLAAAWLAFSAEAETPFMLIFGEGRFGAGADSSSSESK